MKGLLVASAFLLALMNASTVHATVNIETVPVGDVGNPNDPATGSLYGGVNYAYNIGKYDVTVGQYTAFLNAVAATDLYGLFNPSLTTDLNVAGISRSGVAGSYAYSVIGSPNKPITYVTWGDAARFANWLNNGQPTGAEGAGTTETGSYTLMGAVTDAALNAVTRNAGAHWAIPSENEWYKAAYYDPVAQHYWNYPTDSIFGLASAPPGNTPNTANFYDLTSGYAVTGTKTYSASQNYLTDVGAYSASPSPYGTFDQAGNVYQWNEALTIAGYHGSRGGSWNYFSGDIPAEYRILIDPSLDGYYVGFRVAAVGVPEPSTTLLLAIGGCVAAIRRRPTSHNRG